jgi:protoheme IX farnesyltransferase
VTFVAYVFLYTPLKRHTTMNTLIGAVPGALPTVIGWTAHGGGWGAAILALFLLLFLWQIPHFLAIAWLYRGDYARAGLRMLPVFDPSGTATGRQMTTYCLALIPVSLAPVSLGQAGPLYGLTAVGLGWVFFVRSLRFWRTPNDQHARRVLRASLLYLPALLALLLLENSAGPAALALRP